MKGKMATTQTSIVSITDETDCPLCVGLENCPALAIAHHSYNLT